MEMDRGGKCAVSGLFVFQIKNGLLFCFSFAILSSYQEVSIGTRYEVLSLESTRKIQYP
jgi:hypothetical protein